MICCSDRPRPQSAVRCPCATARSIQLPDGENYTPAELMSYLPGTERVDAHTIRYRASSIIDISRFLESAISYRADLVS